MAHSASPTELKSDNLTIAMTKKPGSIVSLDIKVEPKAYDEAYAKAIKAVSKEVSLPGFRKGKAPDKMIQTKYEENIKKQSLDILVQDTFQEAVNLIKIHPFRPDGIRCTFKEFPAKGKGAQLLIEFESAPDVPEISLDQFTFKQIEKPNVTDNDINGVIENIRYYFAKWIDVTDRPVQEGDFVDLDIDKMDEPREVIARDNRFHVQEGQMAKWMRKLIIGLKTNDSAEGTSEFEATPANPNPQNFIPTKCKMTVKAIRVAELPEVNDDFAKKVGVADLGQLRERVLADLHRRAEQEIYFAQHRQIDEWLLNQYHFDMPSSIVQAEKEMRSKDIKENMQKQHLTEDKIEKHLKEVDQKLQHDVEQNYRIFFLLMGFAKKHNITVSNEELARELSQQVMQSPNNTYLGSTSGEIRSRVNQMLLLRKTRDYIIDQAKNKKA